MTANELLEEAKRRYPIGIEFLNLYGIEKGQKCKVTKEAYLSGNNILVYADRPSESVRNSGTFIRYNEEWAPLVITNPKYMIYDIP